MPLIWMLLSSRPYTKQDRLPLQPQHNDPLSQKVNNV